MTILKCKMCGGNVETTENRHIGVCDYCGTKMTLPTAADDRKINLFNRANHFRRLNDFDKALTAYESILNEDNNDAEAHWGVVLSRYGIEYVEDPKTHEMVPTCHRVQLEPILADSDYLAALEYAPDGSSRSLYEEEAKKINEIQKDILAISSKEEPFDIFICYKETTDGGSRTQDSVLAQDIYYHLTNDGFRVFYSKITLEDKLGTAYEPYIFAALNSAKVMVVVGTKPEHINSTWVKNEWGRYLAIMKKDRNRLLIPCYRDMDPYDLPEALSMLQALDMSKIGFMQDLIRGIKKVVDVGTDQSTDVSATHRETSNGESLAPLLKRAFMFLEDGDWKSANEYCEKVLDKDPENVKAYIGKLLVELQINTENELQNFKQPLNEYNNFKKAIRFSDNAYKTVLQGYNKTIIDRIETERKEQIYKNATQHKKLSYSSIYGLEEASKLFQSIKGYKDSDNLVNECNGLIEKIRIQKEREAEESRLRAEEQLKAEKIYNANRKKIILISCAVIVALIVCSIIRNNVIIPAGFYHKGETLLANGEFEQALGAFNQAGTYKDASVRILESYYKYGESCLADKEFDQAALNFEKAGSYKDANEKVLESNYQKAVLLLADDNKVGAALSFIKLGNYSDSFSRLRDLRQIIQGMIAAGESHSVVLDTNGTVWAFGDNGYGQCDINHRTKIFRDFIIAVSARGNHTVSLRKDGTVVAIGENNDGQCDVANWKDIIAISAGGYHTVGLKSDGTVVAAGRSNRGQCDVTDWKDIISVSAGAYHTIGLKADGTVLAVGLNTDGQCNVTDWKDIISVSAGNQYTVGLKADGTVVAAGDNRYSQCNVTDWKDIVAISAGDSHTIGLKVDGTVLAVGENGFRQCEVTDWKDIIAVSAGAYHTIGLKADGTVLAVGLDTDGQCSVTGWKLFAD